MNFSALAIAPGIVLSPVGPDDAEAVCQAYLRNREHLRPWEPRRPESFFTVAGQAARLAELAQNREAGRAMPSLLRADDGTVIGVVNLSGIAMGAFRNALIGYWIDAGLTGRGLATAAVTAVCRLAGEQLGLHRVEAGTVLENVGSQKVLANCGFEHVGTARNYLHIDGSWRDHAMFQKILNDRDPV